MKKYKSLVLPVIGLLCSISVSAHDFEVEGIYHSLTTSTDMTISDETIDDSKKIVINMRDIGYDGWWNGGIRIKENGIETRFAKVHYIDEEHANYSETYEFTYDPNVNYEFYWSKGLDSHERAFDIIIAGETILSASSDDCNKFEDGQRLYPRESNQYINISMRDGYGDGWNGNQIIVKKDGSQMGVATISSGKSQTAIFEYNPSSEYTFYWKQGSYNYECSFDISIGGNKAFSATQEDCRNFTDQMLIYKSETSKIIINMRDSYGDGWDGYAITVKKDGEAIGTATLNNGKSGTQTFPYDPTCDYTFYGNYEGSDTHEISFDMVIDGVKVYTYSYGAPREQFFTYPAMRYLKIVDNEWNWYRNDKTLLVGKLIYSRTLPNTKWNALYLPFKVPVRMLTDKYDVAYFNNMHSYDRDNNGQIDEMEMEIILLSEGTLHANHPYFIRAKNEEAKAMELEFSNIELLPREENSLTCSSVYMDYKVQGNYERNYNLSTGYYAINTLGEWSLIAEDSYLNPFRFYLTISNKDESPVEIGSQKTIRIRLNDSNTTGIEELESSTSEKSIIYDLSGRRVENPSQGIYIMNGKKVFFK